MYEQLLNLFAEVLKRSQFLEEIRVVLKCDSETSRTVYQRLRGCPRKNG